MIQNVDKQMPESLGGCSLEKILPLLVNAYFEGNLEALEDSPELTSLIPNLRLQGELIDALGDFLELVVQLAKREDVKLENLREFMVRASRVRNQTQKHLFRPDMRKHNQEMVDRFQVSGDPTEISNAIDTWIAKTGLESNATQSDYSIEEVLQYTEGFKITRVFEVKLGRESIRIYPVGEKLADQRIEASEVMFSFDGWKSTKRGRYSSAHGSFVVEWEGPSTSDLELVIHHSSSNSWWKNGSENFKIPGSSFRCVRPFSKL